jgi:hypothetical protein
VNACCNHARSCSTSIQHEVSNLTINSQPPIVNRISTTVSPFSSIHLSILCHSRSFPLSNYELLFLSPSRRTGPPAPGWFVALEPVAVAELPVLLLPEPFAFEAALLSFCLSDGCSVFRARKKEIRNPDSKKPRGLTQATVPRYRTGGGGEEPKAKNRGILFL